MVTDEALRSISSKKAALWRDEDTRGHKGTVLLC